MSLFLFSYFVSFVTFFFASTLLSISRPRFMLRMSVKFTFLSFFLSFCPFTLLNFFLTPSHLFVFYLPSPLHLHTLSLSHSQFIFQFVRRPPPPPFAITFSRQWNHNGPIFQFGLSFRKTLLDMTWSHFFGHERDKEVIFEFLQ